MLAELEGDSRRGRRSNQQAASEEPHLVVKYSVTRESGGKQEILYLIAASVFIPLSCVGHGMAFPITGKLEEDGEHTVEAGTMWIELQRRAQCRQQRAPAMAARDHIACAHDLFQALRVLFKKANAVV